MQKQEAFFVNPDHTHNSHYSELGHWTLAPHMRNHVAGYKTSADVWPLQVYCVVTKLARLFNSFERICGFCEAVSSHVIRLSY
jgi:hypothetical protein